MDVIRFGRESGFAISLGAHFPSTGHLQSAHNRGLVTIEQHSQMVALAIEVARMLNGFIRYLRAQTAHP